MPPHLLTDTLHTLQGFLPLCTGPQPSCTDYQRVVGPHPVSYTHLTLPTIYSV